MLVVTWGVLLGVGCERKPADADVSAAAAARPTAAPLPPMPERQPNLLVNGDIETGTGDAPAGWTREPGGTASWAWNQAVSGQRALRVAVEGQPAAWRQAVTRIDPQVRYRFRAHVHATNATPGSHAVSVQWLDVGGRLLAETSASSTVANAWSEVTRHDVSPPPEAASAVVVLRGTLPGTYHFDDVVLTRQDEKVHAADGALPIAVWELTGINLLSNSNMSQRRDSAAVDTGGDGQIVCAAPERCGLPAFWNTWVDAGTPAQTWERMGPGDRVLRTVLPADGQADWRQSVPDIEPRYTYRLTASVRATNIDQGSHGVEVHWLDPAGEVLRRDAVAAAAADAWQTVTAPGLSCPPGAVTARVVLRAYKAGTYDFDDVKLELELSNIERLQELKSAGFTLASAYDLEPAPGRPSLDEVGLVGLRAVYRGAHLVVESSSDSERLATQVRNAAAHPALALWMGPDEPAWEAYDCPLLSPERSGLCPEYVTQAYATVRRADAYWDTRAHRVWVNHAPRGTVQAPLDFSSLTAFNPAADIVSMDVYPLPVGNGHVNLPNASPTSVGDYVDVLYSQVARERERQAKPIWMVLQGFAWDEIAGPTPFDGGDTDTGHQSAAVEVHWLDADERPITRVGEDGVARRVVDVLQSDRPNAWRQVFEQHLQPPPGARAAEVRLRTYGPGTYWFDDLELSEEGRGELLINGSFEDGELGLPTGWQFRAEVGTANASWDPDFARSGTHSVRTEMKEHGQAEWRQVVAVDPTKRYQFSGALHAKLRPDRAETRFMAYLALIRGARGLSWWGNQMIPHNAGLWTDLKQVASELRELTPALMAPDSFRRAQGTAADSGDSLETLVLEAGGSVYVLAANTTPRPGRFRLTLDGLPVTRGERLFEPATLALSADGWSDTFAALQVHVYRLQ